MEVNIEYCNPFNEDYNVWMRAEHLGRYLWTKNFILEHGFKKVLDIACADGYGTKILSDVCEDITGIDNKENYIELAHKDNNAPNIEYLYSNIDENKINKEFDIIVCFETLEHVKFPQKLIKNLYQALKSEGYLLISVPNDKYEIIENGVNKDSYHLHTFSKEELITIFKNNKFKIIDVLGQSTTNKIVNQLIDEPNVSKDNIYDISINYAYPNKEEVNDSYSYIFILKKEDTDA